MKIIEDKADRDALFARLSGSQYTVRAKGYTQTPEVGWARKHQLWPCVRKGSGEVWLSKRGEKVKAQASDRRRSLLFLRGHSHEALLTEGQSLVFVYERVGNEVDEWTGNPDAPFTEVKSTAISSARMWPIVKEGKADIINPLASTYFTGWFQQTCQNCVATGTKTARLRIFFMNGEYGERRKKCPECEAPLGALQDAYKQCERCGYKAYSTDFRSYILKFSALELAHFKREVFKYRRDQFYNSQDAETLPEFLMRAPASRCFLCRGCSVGKQVGCDEFQEVKR